MTRSCLSLVWIFALTATSLFGQSVTDEDPEEPLLQALAKAHIPKPELGWILPNGELISELNSPRITILTEKIAPKTANQIGVIPARNALLYVKKNEVDCDQTDDPNPAALYRYDAKMPASKFTTQVLVLSGDSTAAIQAGVRDYTPTEIEQKLVWQAMKPGQQEKRLSHSLQQPGSSFFYTIAATYRPNGLLQRKGLFLHDQNGKILGSQIEEIDGQNQCDGCAVPTYKDGLKFVRTVQNLFSFSGLPYPVLLEDSSTAEGRAIDLLTFDLSGKEIQFREYEYMVTCLISSD